jgi:chromosome segregation ATPase
MDDNPEKKEGLLGTLGKVVEDLIFEKSAQGEDAKPADTEQPAPAEPKQPAAKVEPPAAVQETRAPADRKIYEKLKAALDSKNSAFSQFEEMLDSLSDVIADEAMRYAAALRAVGKSYGTTLDQIIASLDVKLGTLDKEQEKFSATIKQSETELAEFENRIQQKDQAIESLRKQITALETEKKDIESSISEKKEKIEAVRRDFFSTADTVKMEIGRQKDCIVKYLQGGKQ